MNMYHGGDSWRPPDREPSLSQRNEFTFRNNDIAPQYPRDSDQYRPTRSRQYAMGKNEQARLDNQYRLERNRGDRNRSDQMNLNRNQHGRGYRVATAERPLLRMRRGGTPEQMMGMADDKIGARRFLPAEDISDSAEEQMDESDSDQDQAAPSNAEQGHEEFLPSFETAEDRVGEDMLEPPMKRRALGLGTNETKDEHVAPKWSNPDPYTVLPPVDETQRKKKDVVKIIRKARILSKKEVVVQSQVVANDDFISFGLEEEISADEATKPLRNGKGSANGSTGAAEITTGPRQFSHLHRLHDQGTHSSDDTVVALSTADKTASPPPQTEELQAEPLSFNLDTSNYDTALGNRKRTHDDEIKSELPYSKRRKAGSGMPSGHLLHDWVPYHGTNPTPWFMKTERQTENAGLR